jgi:acetyl-CoA C-acetyltransferase
LDSQEVVIAGACRTPIGDFLGGLKDVSARDLAMVVGSEAMRRAGIEPSCVDELCMGQVYTAMQGSIPARQVGMRIGLAAQSSACTVNQNCASGMRALEIASQNIFLGKTQCALVIGVESMSNAPYLLPHVRTGYRMNAGVVEDHMIHDALYDELVPGHMGVTAENVAERFGITREECDDHGALSHQRAVAAIDEGRFTDEIVPIDVPRKKGVERFDTDEHPRRGASRESLAPLKPAFRDGGVVTAGNAAGINDGASAVVLLAKSKADELGVKPLMKLVATCSAGVDPKVMGLGPAVAIPKCLKHANLRYEDVDYWEIHEAFAAQFLGVKRALKADSDIHVDMDNVNRNGSGIALGHPIGSSGLRIIVSLYHEMQRGDETLGGASLCVGAGPSMASLWTRDV